MSSPYPYYTLCELCGELKLYSTYADILPQKTDFYRFLYRYLKENFIVIHQWRYLLSALF